MVEGGAKVLTAFAELGLADSLALFTSCRIMGEGPGIGTGLRLGAMSESLCAYTFSFFSCDFGY